jgi:hypothetical protein
MLRMLNRDVWSTYGPTADTGGMPASGAPTVYAYRDLDELLEQEAAGREKATLPGAGSRPVTERPETR